MAVSSLWASQKLTGPIVDLAKRLGAEALVAHVAHPKEEDENDSDARRRGEETIKLLTDALREGGVKAEGIMMFSDDVAKAILNTAKARDCTAIILGLTSKSAWKRLIDGNVPGDILRKAELPVLICPSSWSGTV